MTGEAAESVGMLKGHENTLARILFFRKINRHLRLSRTSVGESLPPLVAAAVANVKEMDLGVRETVEKPVWTLNDCVKSVRIAVMFRAHHWGVRQRLGRRSDPGFKLVGGTGAEPLFYRNRYLEKFGVERRREDDPTHGRQRGARSRDRRSLKLSK